MEHMFKELECYGELKVALEGMDSLPDDAKKLLGMFSPEVNSLNRKVAIESIGEKIKDGVKKVYEWIKSQIVQLIDFFKSGKLEIEQIKKEWDTISARVKEAKRFKTEKIALSPTITGYLAVKGKLAPDFVGSLGHVNSVINKLFDLQPNAINLSESIIKQLNEDTESKYQRGRVTDETLVGVGKLLYPLASELKTVDPSKNIYNATKVNTLGQRAIKVLDLVSTPLPGGYVIQGAYIEKVSSFGFGDTTSTGILKELLSTIKPSLTKVYSSGISFSGKALSKNECNGALDISKSILLSIDQSFSNSSSFEKALENIKGTLDKFKEDEDDLTVLSILKELVKFVKMDKDEIVRYSLKVVRATLRYVNESIDNKKEEDKPIPENMRLN